MAKPAPPLSAPKVPHRTHQAFRSISRHWLAWLNLLVGIWVILPWLAPVLMQSGSVRAANLIYLVYAPQCHQLPQRSYFLFGDSLMVSLDTILAVYPTSDPLALRPFLGTPELGWKVAWSDRMVSLYTPILLGGLLYALSRKRWHPARWRWRLLLPYLPLAIDGASHGVNDLLYLGFRDTNNWLAAITGNAFAATFYAGDLLGSFNWWMRLLTGVVAGFAFTRLIYPYINKGVAALAPEQNIAALSHPLPE
jgi:uncharacterized membrane protein